MKHLGKDLRAAKADLPVPYQPRWCAPTPDVSYIDVLRAAGAPRLVSILSLQLAFRPARLDLGEAVAVVPALNWLPSLHRWSMTRLLARCGGVRERMTLYALTGLASEDVEHLKEPGLPWLVLGTEAGVELRRPGLVEHLGLYSPEVILSAISRALGVASVEVEKPATGWFEGLVASRFNKPDAVGQAATRSPR